MDYAKIHGEARSHRIAFARAIVAAHRRAFRSAASRVTDHRGRKGKVSFSVRLDYRPFRLAEGAPAVRLARAAATEADLAPRLLVAKGGLDANWLVQHGIPTVTFGAGQEGIHSVGESVRVPEFLDACRYAVTLATVAARDRI